MVDIAVIISSILDITRLSVEMAEMVKRINNGGTVTEQEWDILRDRLQRVNDDWENA
jgi:hypothetical protein